MKKHFLRNYNEIFTLFSLIKGFQISVNEQNVCFRSFNEKVDLKMCEKGLKY